MLAVSLPLSRSLPLLSLSLPFVLPCPETVSLPFLSLCIFRFMYYADRNYSSSSLCSSSSAMVSIAGGTSTEDSADPELIVSFGVQ
jgi:hypothetical protein